MHDISMMRLDISIVSPIFAVEIRRLDRACAACVTIIVVVVVIIVLLFVIVYLCIAVILRASVIVGLDTPAPCHSLFTD